MAYHLAVDIGASSGRHIIGWVENGRIHTEEVYRFENRNEEKDGQLVWDVRGLFMHIIQGMKQCAQTGKVPATMGVDTWAVDFVLLDAQDKLIGNAVAYRDSRNVGMDAEVEKILSFDELYRRTGIQKLSFNTIYQLMALKLGSLTSLATAKNLLMLPDYFHFLLTDQKRQEYTNATSTALVDAQTKTWDYGLIDMLGYPRHLFGELSKPGTMVGQLSPDIVQQVGFECTVVLPATHDTGSAYLAVPAKDENAVYLSSGTWSLLGIESLQPIITSRGRKANFSNEGGYDYRFRFLKNIMGLWMIQSVKRQSRENYSYAQLEQMARETAGEASIVDVNDDAFLAPRDMYSAIEDMCRSTGQPVPQTMGEMMRCVYQSLALCYKTAIEELQEITGRTFTSINIVGGGCKDGYLNELTAKATGLPVYAGPSEGTTIGNLMAQMLAAGEFTDLQQARDAVAKSFEIKKFLP